MVRTNVLLATLLLVSAIFAATAVAAPLPNDQHPNNFDNGIRTSLQADLTMKSELLLRVVSDSEAGATRLGFCQCGCGARCQTSADCGGAPCRPFITCCLQSTPAESLGLGRSSRAGEEPAVGVNCK
jgi:hypothetical protein